MAATEPMKLLFDENLSARLVDQLADLFPGSAHVRPLDLGGKSDRSIWNRAARDGFVLVTKDEDFHRMSVFEGPPPKVIWIRLGNCSTADVARVLRQQADVSRAFVEHADAAFVALG